LLVVIYNYKARYSFTKPLYWSRGLPSLLCSGNLWLLHRWTVVGPSTAEVENEWGFTTTLTHAFVAC